MGEARQEDTKFYTNIAFGFCIFFMLLEGVELAKSGAAEYFQDMWNLMDWANFIIFLLTFASFRELYRVEADRGCSELCASHLTHHT